MLTMLGGQFLKSVEIGLTSRVSPSGEETLDTALKGFQRGWPKRRVDLIGAEESDGWLILSHLHVAYSEDADDEKLLAIDLDCNKYDVEDRLAPNARRRLTRGIRKIREALELLEPHTIDKHFHCTLGWRFPADEITSAIHLPLLQISIPGTPFEQVSGVRLTGAPSSPFEYAILDLEGQDNLQLTIRFQYYDSLSPATIDTVVRKGEEIREHIVKAKDS